MHDFREIEGKPALEQGRLLYKSRPSDNRWGPVYEYSGRLKDIWPEYSAQYFLFSQIANSTTALGDTFVDIYPSFENLSNHALIRSVERIADHCATVRNGNALTESTRLENAATKELFLGQKVKAYEIKEENVRVNISKRFLEEAEREFRDITNEYKLKIVTQTVKRSKGHEDTLLSSLLAYHNMNQVERALGQTVVERWGPNKEHSREFSEWIRVAECVPGYIAELTGRRIADIDADGKTVTRVDKKGNMETIELGEILKEWE